MKRQILIIFIFSTKFSFSQIVNGGFEVWDTVYTNSYSSELSAQFGVPDPLGGIVNSWKFDYPFGISRTTDSYSGNYSLILHNWYSYAYQSVIYEDSISYSPQYLQCYYKYITGNTNGLSQGNANVVLTHFNGISNDTVAAGTYTFDSISAFTPFQIPINYISALPPDSIHINILNGNTICIGGNVCNLLYLDNLTLSNSPLAIENHNTSDDRVVVFPNPSSADFTIQNNSYHTIQFTLYNSMGEKLIDKVLPAKASTISLSAYSTGIYFYKINIDNTKITNEKIIKQ